MASLSTSAPPAIHAGRGPAFLPFLLILFIGSGCSALMYEIVWFQMLEFAIGSSAASMAVLLGTFMGGLCLGSLLFARLIPVAWHPLRTYAFLEAGIGVLGVLITMGMPSFDRLYAALAHGGASGVGLRAVIAVVCLLPPTFLMGATLPAISRWIESTPRGVAWLGFFYGGNTVGAVFGCLLAGFYLLPQFTMAAATYAAATINLSVALVGVLIASAAPYTPPAAPAKAAAPATPAERLNAGTIYVAIGLSGMAALGAEVVWTRLLSLLLGATVYTFSIILAVFLVGLGIGSSVGAMLTRSGVNARAALAWCQILLAGCIGWSAYAVTNGLPHWPVDTYLAVSNSYRFELDLARCAWAILPPTLFWGASFPLALAAIIGGGSAAGVDPARAVGRVYAANTVGAIIGALFFSLIAIAAWGSQSAQHIMISCAGLAAFVALFPNFIPKPGVGERDMIATVTATAASMVFAVAVPVVGIGLLLHYDLDVVPWKLIAWGRDTPTKMVKDFSALVAEGEGMNSSVAVTADGTDLFFHVAGKVEASTIPLDMHLQLMLGHYPALFHREPAKEKKVLVVGCGAGVTAGSFILYPHEKIVLCELEPLVPKMATHFSTQNNNVVTRKLDGSFVDPRVQIIFDDARHYVLTTDEKFDIITSDPIHPWVKGAACLYTKEYFETVKAHLNPNGLVTQWVPLYESDMEVVKSEIKTFFEVFPNGTLWTNSDVNGGGYDIILLGSVEPMMIDSMELQKRLDNAVLQGVLKDAHLNTAADILRTYGGRAADLKEWTDDGQTNHDANLRLQYLAGMANTKAEASEIQAAILSYRRFPEGLLRVSPAERQALEAGWYLRAPAP